MTDRAKRVTAFLRSEMGAFRARAAAPLWTTSTQNLNWDLRDALDSALQALEDELLGDGVPSDGDVILALAAHKDEIVDGLEELTGDRPDEEEWGDLVDWGA